VLKEFCSSGPNDSTEVLKQVVLFDSGSNWCDYCLHQAAICYGHGVFHASMIFTGEALETRLRELSPTIDSFECLVKHAPLGDDDKRTAHSIRWLRHYHVHPPHWLRKKTKEGVKEVIQRWGVEIGVPEYVKEILEFLSGKAAPDKRSTAFNRPEVAKKCIEETMRLLSQLVGQSRSIRELNRRSHSVTMYSSLLTCSLQTVITSISGISSKYQRHSTVDTVSVGSGGGDGGVE